jgi:hypothetical protein
LLAVALAGLLAALAALVALLAALAALLRRGVAPSQCGPSRPRSAPPTRVGRRSCAPLG